MCLHSPFSSPIYNESVDLRVVVTIFDVVSSVDRIGVPLYPTCGKFEKIRDLGTYWRVVWSIGHQYWSLM